MNHYRKTGWNKLPFIILLVLIIAVSCHFRRGTTSTEAVPQIDIAQIDSIRIIYTADEDIQRDFPRTYWSMLNRLLSTAQYDTEWNDSGIMIAMIAQDYSLIISYTDLPQEENEWFLVWRNNERIKYRNKWYFVNATLKDELCDVIETWK